MRELTNISSTVMDPLLRADPSGPRITYYDDATGERIELSTATLANWAAKTGNLLRDELGAGPGSRVAVLLPAHWQTVGVLFGIWYVGAEVVLGQGDCDVAFCTEKLLGEADAVAGSGEVVALSLDAFGRPIADLPFGITDYATSVRVHGDHILAESNPGPALNGTPTAEVMAHTLDSVALQGLVATDRVLSTAAWDTPEALIADLLAVYAAGASLVQVAHPDPAAQDRRRRAENVTRG